MARLPRYDAVGYTRHVIQRGNNRSAIFMAAGHYSLFKDCLETAARRNGCRVHAYVLMTNHLHLLVTPVSAGAVGRVMQAVGSRYVPRFNRTHARTGTLWEGRYRATVVDCERYL